VTNPSIVGVAPDWRSVPGRRHGRADLEAVVLVQDVEELSVGVVVLPARVRVGAIHVGGDRVRHDLAVSAVLGPCRNRVGEVFADHAFEGLPAFRSVEMAKHVVQ
jgi:hypothetical protein